MMLSIELEPMVEDRHGVGLAVPVPDKLRSRLQGLIRGHFQITVAFELSGKAIKFPHSGGRQSALHFLLQAPCNASGKLARGEAFRQGLSAV